MGIQHIFGLFIDPKTEWTKIRDQSLLSKKIKLLPLIVLAAIPAVSGYIGTTQIGWRIGAGDPVRLTHDTAIIIAFAYYLALLIGTLSIGWAIQLMGKIYGTNQPLSRCVTLATYTATPLFLIGIIEIYPLLWLNMLIGVTVLAYTIYLLFTGLPIMMDIPPERGFLFSITVLGIGLIALVALITLTALLWGMGLHPVFTR